MNEGTELKSCPFCGSDNVEVESRTVKNLGRNENTFAVVCQDCGARGSVTWGIQSAVYDWNQRVARKD